MIVVDSNDVDILEVIQRKLVYYGLILRYLRCIGYIVNEIIHYSDVQKGDPRRGRRVQGKDSRRGKRRINYVQGRLEICILGYVRIVHGS